MVFKVNDFEFLGLGIQKGYELQSWIGQQGEITRIEGMLIIDFLLFLPCSHKEKTINLSMMIHYMIGMPYDSDFPTKGKKRFDYGQHEIKRNKELDEFIDKLCNTINLEEPFSEACVHPSSSYFYSPEEVLKKVEVIITEKDNLRKEVEEIKKQHELEINSLRKEFNERISKLENEKNKESNELKQTVLRLREIIGKKCVDWQIDWDLAWRINPITKKIERYNFPPDFDKTKVKNVDFTDDEGYMCHFKYFFSEKEDDFKEWDMPYPLLKALQSLLKNKGKTISLKNVKPLELKDGKEIKKILEEAGEDIDDLDYLDDAINFLCKRKGEKFGTNDFQRETNISSPSTVQIYLKMLVRCNIIIRPKKGWYKVNIK